MARTALGAVRYANTRRLPPATRHAGPVRLSDESVVQGVPIHEQRIKLGLGAFLAIVVLLVLGMSGLVSINPIALGHAEGYLIAGLVGCHVNPENPAEMPALFTQTTLFLLGSAVVLGLLIIPIRRMTAEPQSPG